MDANNSLFLVHFSQLEDPRLDRKKRHSLLDIVTITICAVIAGADAWTDVALFGKSKEAWLKTFLKLPNGIPSHDTFGRFFSLLDPAAFQNCFMNWVKAIHETVQGVVAIDGKTARRSRSVWRHGSLVKEEPCQRRLWNRLCLAPWAVANE